MTSEEHTPVYVMLRPGVEGRLLRKLWPLLEAEQSVRFLVERRSRERERRHRADPRSSGPWRAVESERRLVQNQAGRRVAERRMPLLPIQPPPGLSPALKPHLGRLHFFQPEERSETEELDIVSDRLVVAAQAGQAQALAELYRLYFEPVNTYLSIAFGDSHEAEDLAQQAFMKAFQALHRYQVKPGAPFRAWLYRIVRNTGLSHLEKRRPVSPEAPEIIVRRLADQPQPESRRAYDLISDSQLFPMIKRLPELQRKAIVLRHLLGLDNLEIALMLGRSPEAIRQLQHRAFQDMRARSAGFGRIPKQPRRPIRGLCPPNQIARSRRYALTGL